MGSILQVLALVGFGIAVLGIALTISASSQRAPARGGVLVTIIGMVIGVVFLIMSQGLLVVPVTERAVIYNALTGALETPRGPGISIIIPGVQQPYLYPINNQTYYMTDDPTDGSRGGQDAVRAKSREGQDVRVNAILTYKLDSTGDGLNKIHQDWNNQVGGYESGLVRPTLNNVVQSITSTYTAEDIYGAGRVLMETQMTERLTEVLAANGVDVVAFRILELTFNEDFTQAIERKEIANQELQRAETEALRVQAEAKGEADARIEQARGEAESVRVRAQAEAEALALISAQISANPALIQYRYIENLSDNVQLILVPSNSPFLFDMESLTGMAPATTPPDGE
jgi:regulator of protease activity HflC (stomatin/prohibitin superfamily)